MALSGPLAAQDRTITVTGTGEISVEPDMATVIVAVQTEAEDAATALDGASVATTAVLDRLAAIGVVTNDIRSGAIRLNPRYNQSVLSSGTQISGYQALNSIEVEVRDLARLGALMSAVVGEGANRLDGVRFGLQDPQAATDEARRRAVAEALRLADLYAGAAGIAVGDILALSEGHSGGYFPLMAEARDMQMATTSPDFDVPVAPGKIDLQASVSVVFAIAD